MTPLYKTRSLASWLYEQTDEELVCPNPFHTIMQKVYAGGFFGGLDPYLDEGSVPVKMAKLVKAGLVIPEGDIIYVREQDNLIPIGEATDLLSYYMHGDSREARAGTDLVETNFQGYFPVTSNAVWRNGITLLHEDGTETHIDLTSLNPVMTPPGIPEYGRHPVTDAHIAPLTKYFDLINQAVGEAYFFEKTMLYPFNQRIREKSHVLTGGGGNGKSLYMMMMKRLYGNRAYTDAPQPNFKGHDPATIAYNFIGKRVVTFNDVGDPSIQFLEWLKRMITGNLEVKTPSGAWLSVPCKTNFLLESNHRPQLLDLEAHNRRYIVREFAPDFKLIEHMTNEELDLIGERGIITAGDLVTYLSLVKPLITDWLLYNPPSQVAPLNAASF